jgi:hypothetical protein
MFGAFSRRAASIASRSLSASRRAVASSFNPRSAARPSFSYLFHSGLTNSRNASCGVTILISPRRSFLTQCFWGLTMQMNDVWCMSGALRALKRTIKSPSSGPGATEKSVKKVFSGRPRLRPRFSPCNSASTLRSNSSRSSPAACHRRRKYWRSRSFHAFRSGPLSLRAHLGRADRDARSIALERCASPG